MQITGQKNIQSTTTIQMITSTNIFQQSFQIQQHLNVPLDPLLFN